MINNNKCIVCKGSIVKRHSKGVVARFDLINSQAVSIDKSKIYPSIVYKEISNWVNHLLKKPILITRRRKTNYNLRISNLVFNLDPTIYDILQTWNYTNTKKDKRHIISGRDGIIAYAFGRILLGYDVNHLFIPRFEIKNWSSMIKLDSQEIMLLLIGALSWKKNRVIPSLNDLIFIKKGLTSIIKNVEKIQVREPIDLLKFNRNLFNIK